MSQTSLIESLKSKITRIIADNRRLREQNSKLLASAERLRADKKERQERITELEHRINVLELSASIGGGAEHKKLARARINRLMREVDRCIALVNKQTE